MRNELFEWNHAYENQRFGDAIPPPPGPRRSTNGLRQRDHTGYAAQHYPVTNELIFERPAPFLASLDPEYRQRFHHSSYLGSSYLGDNASSAKFDAEFARLDLESRATDDKGKAPASAEKQSTPGIDLRHADTEPSSLPSGPDVETDFAVPGAASNRASLRDYQVQLRALEQQNKKRLLQARNEAVSPSQALAQDSTTSAQETGQQQPASFRTRFPIFGAKARLDLGDREKPELLKRQIREEWLRTQVETERARWDVNQEAARCSAEIQRDSLETFESTDAAPPTSLREHVVELMLADVQRAKREALARAARGDFLPGSVPANHISPLQDASLGAAGALPFPEQWRDSFSTDERRDIEAEVNTRIAELERTKLLELQLERAKFLKRRQERQQERQRDRTRPPPEQPEQPQEQPQDQLPRIGADTIPPHDAAVAGADADADADALAQTAGALLDGLQGEQGDKFRQSGFLALMRRMRDREVRVEGDAVVPAETPRAVPAAQASAVPREEGPAAEPAQAPHPGGRRYPSDAFAGRHATVEEVRDEATVA